MTSLCNRLQRNRSICLTWSERPIGPKYLDRRSMKHFDALRSLMTSSARSVKNPRGFLYPYFSLIAHNEVGGSPDQDFLKDLDSLSFFANNAAYFLDKQLKRFSVAQVSEKFNWMYNRMTHHPIIETTKPLYNEAMLELEKYGF